MESFCWGQSSSLGLAQASPPCPVPDPGTGAQPTPGPSLQGSWAAAGAPLTPPFVSSGTVFYIINCQLYQSSVNCVLKMAWQN